MRIRLLAWGGVAGLILIGYALMGQPIVFVSHPPAQPIQPSPQPQPVFNHRRQSEHRPRRPSELNPPNAPDQPQPTPIPDQPPAPSGLPPVVRNAVLLSVDNLEYPSGALRRGISGHVVVDFTIMPDGTVGDVQVVEASPPGVFEDAALRYVLSRRYQPRTQDGVAVATPNARVDVVFKLH